MLAQSIMINPVFAQDSSGFGEEYELLKALGIVNSKIVIDDKDITRGEFAILLANLSGFYDGGDEISHLVDVEEEYFSKNEINYVASKGYMKGRSDDKFCPGYNLTADEAYRVVLTALGYGIYAANSGGYTATASSIGLSKGVNVGRQLSKKSAVRLIYNALDTGILSASEYKVTDGGVSQVMKTTETPLTEWLNLDYAEGLVTKVGTSVINNDYSIGGDFMIGDTSLELSKDDNVYEYLGFVCRAYYDKDDYSLKAVVNRENKNDITQIDTASCVYVDDAIVYDNGKGAKRVEVKAIDEVVLNGVPVAADERESAISNADGRIVVNKVSDYDGKIILITSYETYYVSGISQEKTTIYDRVNTARRLVIDYDNASVDIKYSDGSECRFEQIKTGNVLSILRHGTGDDVTVIVSDKSVSGKLTAKSVEDLTIEISATEYAVTKDYITKDLPEPGTSITAYLDCFGRVAYIDDGGSEGYSYGFIRKYYPSDDDDTLLSLNIFTLDGTFVTYNTREKTKIDGKTFDTPDKKIEALSKENGNLGVYRLVRYKLNSAGEISHIDTSVNTSGSESDSNRMIKIHSASGDSLLYKQEPKAFGHTRDVGIKVVTDASTIVLKVPQNANAGTNTKLFKVSSLSSYTNDYAYSIDAYKSSLKDIPADIIVEYVTEGSAEKYAYGFIKELQQVYDEDEDAPVMNITMVTSQYGEKVYKTEADFDIADAVKAEGEADDTLTPGKGDIVKVGLDSQEQILSMEVYYDASAASWLPSTAPYGSIYNDHFYYGTVYRKDGQYLQMSNRPVTSAVSQESLLSSIPLASNVRIIKFETASNKAEEISVDELLDFESVGASASRVVAITRAASGKVVIAYE